VPQPGASPAGPPQTSALAGASQTFKKALDQATDKVGQAGPNREFIRLIPLGAGLLALLSSFLPYYTVHVSVFGFNQNVSVSAWGNGSGWVGALLALLGGAAVSLPTLFGKTAKMTPAAVAQSQIAGLVTLGVAWLLVIISIFSLVGSDVGYYSDFVSTGLGVGFWLTALFTTAALVTAALIWRSSRSRGGAPATDPSAPTALPPYSQTSPAGPGQAASAPAYGPADPGQPGPVWSDPTNQAAPPWSPPPATPPTAWPPQPPAGPPIG
jgi:hypothetical protein